MRVLKTSEIRQASGGTYDCWSIWSSWCSGWKSSYEGWCWWGKGDKI